MWWNGNSKRNSPLGWPPKMMKDNFLLYNVEKHCGERVSVLEQIHWHAPLDEPPFHPLDQGALRWKKCLECRSNVIVLQFWWRKHRSNTIVLQNCELNSRPENYYFYFSYHATCVLQIIIKETLKLERKNLFIYIYWFQHLFSLLSIKVMLGLSPV